MFHFSKVFWLSIFSALLLSGAWYGHLGILIFFAWVPLLLIEDKRHEPAGLGQKKLPFFLLVYLSFFLWNLLVTWWIVYASFGGACMAIFANSLLMTMVFALYSVIKKRINKSWGVWVLVPIWIAWEYGHGLWDLSWTWLNLGNVFAFHHQWVQWYEFTGASGGSAWVLLVNILVFQTIKNHKQLTLFSKPLLVNAAAIILPILLSYAIYFFRNPLTSAATGKKVVVVQPNIDPYNFKFVMEYQEQFFKVLNLIKGSVNAETDFLVLPETFITNNIDERILNTSEEIQWFRDSLLSKYPKLEIICGGNTYEFYENQNEVTATARLDKSSGKSYDVYNSAIHITKNKVDVYHKSKLVPGVERMPFPAIFKPLEKLALDLGGTVGSLGIQDNRSVFTSEDKGLVIAPVICYESIYSDYVADYCRLGANFIFIVTNDGWWDDTPGYIQHLNYGRLRAIENRRQIARSANTGVSCFIDEFGNISEPTSWWKEAVIKKTIYSNNTFTFFTRYGDLISLFSILMSFALLLVYAWIRLRNRA